MNSLRMRHAEDQSQMNMSLCKKLHLGDADVGDFAQM